MNYNNISIDQIIIAIIIILIFIIFFLIVLGNIIKVKKGVKETNESSRNTRQKIEDLDQQIKRLNADNKEVIKVHKQIKDKSEAMNKMFKQTNRIYKEVLDKKSEIDTKEGEFVEIDYDKINSKPEEASGKHLTQLLNSINSDKENISRKINTNSAVNREVKPTLDSLTQIDLENIKLMNREEIEELFITLKDYKIILNKEIDYYLDQIEQINRHKGSLTPEQRLKKKEYIYNEIKAVEKKINYQQTLIEEVQIRKENIITSEKTVQKERELDELISSIARR